jgi:hypothetical protein
MTDEFEVAMRKRMTRLAAAVPVDEPASVARVPAGSVKGGAASRLRLGWGLPIVAVVALAALAGIVRLSQVGPGATGAPITSQRPPAEPISATVNDGLFDLTIRANSDRYAVGEPIAIDAVLVYRGVEPITISHAQGAPVPGRGSAVGPDTGGTGGPIGFGILEPVLGDLRLGESWAESCERTTLQPGQPLVVPFAKGGAWSSDDPRAAEYLAFVQDPALTLAPGTWHAYAVAWFYVGDCGGDEHKPRVELEFEVSRDAVNPTIDPAAPTPGIAPEPSTAPVLSSSTDGPYALELRSERAVYHESEVIEVSGAFVYRGAASIDVQGFKPLVFGVQEPVYGIDLDMATTLECNHETLEPGERIEAQFVKGGGVSTSDPEYAFKKAYLQDPVFRLPPGTWHIQLAGWLYEGDCGTDKTTLLAQVEITVLPDPPPSAATSSTRSSARGGEAPGKTP